MVTIKQEIISAYKLVNIDTDWDAILDLASAIEAPPSLDGIAVAFSNMAKVLPSLIEISEGEDHALFRKWSEALQSIVSNDNSELPKNMRLATLKANFCEDRPLYSVLLKMPKFDLPEHKVIPLVAHFFLAYQQEYGFNEYKIGVAVRRLCVKTYFKKNYDDFAEHFEADGLEKLIVSFSYALGLETADATKNHLLKLRSLFDVHRKKHEAGIEIKKPIGIPDSKYIPGNQSVERDDDDPYANDVGSTVSFKEISPSKRASTVALGNAPEEAASSREVASEQVDVDTPADVAKDLFRLKMRSTRIANAIAENNQILPTDWEQLNVFDLYILIYGLQLLAEDVGGNRFGVPSVKLATALTLSFVRGSPLSSILTMQSISASKRNKNHTHHVVFERGNDQVLCLSNAQLYSQGKRATLKMLGLVRAIDKSYQLEFKLPYWAGLIVIKAAGAIANMSHDETLLFSEPAEDYIKAAREWLSSIRGKYKNCRLTEDRVASFLVKYAMQAPAFDIAEVAYAHGNPHAIQSTQLYYTAGSKARISHIYFELWAAIQASVMKEATAIGNSDLFPEMLTQAEMPLGTHDAGYVGSEIVPTREAVSELSSFLQVQEKLASEADVPPWKWIVDYHNAFTAYTIYFLSYSTAYRAVCDPLPDPRFFDELTQLLVISDKDDDDAYNTRLVWICDTCKNQLNNYSAHLEVLKNKTIHLKPATFDQITATQKAANALPERPAKRVRLQKRVWPPHLFFLKDDGSIEAITPSALEAKVEKTFPLPFNASRHFIRTELVMSQHPDHGRCPSHIIDAFLGHWLRGREPWSELSTLSPVQFVEQLRPYLEELVASCGWRAIRSKLI